MNLWRWLGVSLFLFGAFALVGAANFAALAQDKGGTDKDKQGATDKDKDKDKQPVKDKDKDKPADKDKDVKDKDKPADKDKDVKDKDKDKDVKKDKDKTEVKPQPSGEKIVFKAFDPKSTFFQQQFTKTKQVMVVQSQKVEQNQEQTFMIQWTAGDKDKDGNYVVKQKIVGVKMKIDIGGNQIKYDSTEKNPKNPMTDFFNALTQEELEFTITPGLDVKSIENKSREKFVKNLVDINPQMQGLLKAILSDKALTRMAEPTWWAYPKDGVLPKADWERTAKLELGPIGDYTTKFTFTNKGEKSGKQTIGIKTILTYSAPESKQGLPFTIQKADLKGENGEGEAVFDIAKGRFESTTMKSKITGKLTIEVGNMTTEVELNQDQESSSTTMDALPEAWKTKQ